MKTKNPNIVNCFVSYSTVWRIRFTCYTTSPLSCVFSLYKFWKENYVLPLRHCIFIDNISPPVPVFVHIGAYRLKNKISLRIVLSDTEYSKANSFIEHFLLRISIKSISSLLSNEVNCLSKSIAPPFHYYYKSSFGQFFPK